MAGACRGEDAAAASYVEVAVLFLVRGVRRAREKGVDEVEAEWVHQVKQS